MDIYGHIWTYTDIYKHFLPVSRSPWGGNSPRGGNSPELCDWWWPASGGSAPSEKTRPGFFEDVSCEFSRFWWIWGPPGIFFKKWTICPNDYASQTRTEILCKKTCCNAGGVQSKSNLLSNSGDSWTLARMSTWTINKYSRSIGLIKVHINKTFGTSPWIFFNLVDPLYIYIYIYIYIYVYPPPCL